MRDLIGNLDAKVARRFEGLDRKVDRLREELAVRIDALDQTVDRFRDTLDYKFSRQFGWLVVFHLTTLVAILGALVTR